MRPSEKALPSTLFIQEREEPANQRQAYHSHEERLLSAQSLSVCHVRTERPAIENGDRENFKQFLTFQFKIFFVLKRPSTGILTLFQKGVQPVKVSQVSAKRWKEKIGGKAREEGPCAQSIWKQSQPQCGPEWYLHNSIFLWIREKVCLDAPSDWWTAEPEAEVKTAQSRVTKNQWQRWMCMTIGQECFRTTSRRRVHGDHGKAQSIRIN